MRLRDWAGSILVACLIALAAITRHGIAVRIFAAGAVGATFVIAIDVLLPKWKTLRTPLAVAATDPNHLAPPTVEQLHERVALDYWGNERYQASAEWNPEEQQAFLTLHRRDAGVSQRVRMKVFDPTNFAFEKHPFTTYEEIVTVRFPRDFQDKDFKLVPEPIIKGEYSVKWFVLVDDLSEAPIDGGTFRVPHNPDEGATQANG